MSSLDINGCVRDLLSTRDKTKLQYISGYKSYLTNRFYKVYSKYSYTICFMWKQKHKKGCWIVF